MEHLINYQILSPQNTQPSTQLIDSFWHQPIQQSSLTDVFKQVFTKSKTNTWRILDLGASLGQSYHLITNIKSGHNNLSYQSNCLFNPQDIELYLGLESDYDKVSLANERFNTHKEVRFLRIDLKAGFKLLKDVEAPFDLYYFSQASASQLSPHDLSALLANIWAHAKKGSLVVLDLLTERGVKEVNFTANAWQIPVWKELLSKLNQGSESSYQLLKVYDYAVLNRNAEDELLEPLLLQLLSPNQITDLKQLKLASQSQNPTTEDGKKSWEIFYKSWNYFIDYAYWRLENELPEPEEMQGWDFFTPHLKLAIMSLDRVVKSSNWLEDSDRRSSIIEPYIGYLLRSIRQDFYTFEGLGQGFCSILQVNKA